MALLKTTKTVVSVYLFYFKPQPEQTDCSNVSSQKCVVQRKEVKVDRKRKCSGKQLQKSIQVQWQNICTSLHPTKLPKVWWLKTFAMRQGRKERPFGANLSLTCDSWIKTHRCCCTAAAKGCYATRPVLRRYAAILSVAGGRLRLLQLLRWHAGAWGTLGNRQDGQGTMGQRRRKRATDGGTSATSVEPQNVQVVFLVERR